MLISLVSTNKLVGQNFPSEIWHQGKLVLIGGDTLKGRIKYDFKNDMIQLDQNNSVQAFGSRKILYFEIFDDIIKNYRYFYALPFNVQSNYQVPILFEVLYEGSLTLLSREFIIQETVPQYGYYYGSPMNDSRYRLSYDYYFLDKKGKISKYQLKKDELLDIMKRKSPEVKQYIKKNNLRYDRREDLVRIIAYYNALLNS